MYCQECQQVTYPHEMATTEICELCYIAAMHPPRQVIEMCEECGHGLIIDGEPCEYCHHRPQDPIAAERDELELLHYCRHCEGHYPAFQMTSPDTCERCADELEQPAPEPARPLPGKLYVIERPAARPAQAALF